ncbi:adenosine deaminase [Agrilactobacillus fermenti]|uniref:adenosine deaminase n=1 Tax=Agrilactobacillus fermenti TaxID=2586909 RepID=UPI001E5377E1|nr:adenosine deaminase [Agrilactobacillus fermenti]
MSLSIETLKQLPKIELHCHLDGSLSLHTIRTLAQMAGITVPADDQALTKLTQVDDQITSLVEYLEKFDFVAPLLQTAPALELAAYDVMRQAAAENVRYIEIRFAPAFSIEKDLTLSTAIQAVLTGIAKAESSLPIKGRLLICGMRQLTNQANIDAFQAALPFQSSHHLAGIDFAGNEADFPPDVLKPAIEFANQHGLAMTLHAGECHCAHNIYEAIKLGAKRIGHGTALYQEPELATFIKANHTCLELCLTSNLQTKAINAISEFPYDLIIKNKLSACINTDNRTVSNTTLTKEYSRFQDHFGTDKAQFLAFNLAGIAAAFCDSKEKTALTMAFKQAYA